jgi:hypothetical protein
MSLMMVKIICAITYSRTHVYWHTHTNIHSTTFRQPWHTTHCPPPTNLKEALSNELPDLCRGIKRQNDSLEVVYPKAICRNVMVSTPLQFVLAKFSPCPFIQIYHDHNNYEMRALLQRVSVGTNLETYISVSIVWICALTAPNVQALQELHMAPKLVPDDGSCEEHCHYCGFFCCCCRVPLVSALF